MGWDLLVKPQFDNGGGGLVVKEPGSGTIRDADGNVLDTFSTGSAGHEGYKVQSGAIQSGLPLGSIIEFNGQTYNIDGGNVGSRYEFTFGNSSPTSIGNKGALGGAGGGSVDGTAFPFNPGPFPGFPTISFPTIEAAPYNFTDPIEFAKKFGEFNRGELDKNFDQAQGFALDALGTELEGLKFFAPAAAALSREQSSIDNIFNQQQRERQVNAAIPEARGEYGAIRGALRDQGDRAAIYAQGRLPDEQLDRAFELGIRSSAADRATFGGIGPLSQASRNISDLMSADARFQIAQYGENLTGTNTHLREGLIREEANLFLAPTEYASTGRQIRPTPEVGAGRLTYQGFGQVNEATLIPPSTALNTQVQQEQFQTQLQQRTNEFNATGTFDARKFNATGTFTAAVGAFEANAQYLSAVQAANQGVLNNQLAAGLGQLNQQGFNSGLSNGQSSGAITSIGQAIGGIAAAAGGIRDILQPNNQSSSGGGETVGGTNVDTSPSQSGGSSSSSTALPPASSIPQSQTSVPGQFSPVGATGDGGSPGTYTFPAGAPVPNGFSTVGSTSDGRFIAASTASYAGDLERFAKYAGSPIQNLSVAGAASVDRRISESAGIAYLPVNGFQPIGISGSGAKLYSSPATANTADPNLGRDKVITAAAAANQLGVSSPAIYDALGTVAITAGSEERLAQLSYAYANGGEEGLTQALTQQLGISPKEDNKASQRAAFGAARIADLWPNLSPTQRSLAISSLAADVVEAKTGRDITKEIVPGTHSAVKGPLTVGDAVGITANGQNGFALARNWGQLSAFGDFIDPSLNAAGTAQIAGLTGMLGFGPQGAAVSVQPQYLSQVGAEPAPELGIGAAVFQKPDHVPQNYRIVSSAPDGRPIAMPANLVHTASLSTGAPEPLAYQKAKEVQTGRHPAQSLWGKSRNGAIRGAAGGSAIVSGFNLMRDANPSLAGSIVGYSLFNNVLGA